MAAERVSPNHFCDAEQNAKIFHRRTLAKFDHDDVCVAEEWAAVVKHYALFGAGVLLRNGAHRTNVIPARRAMRV